MTIIHNAEKSTPYIHMYNTYFEYIMQNISNLHTALTLSGPGGGGGGIFAPPSRFFALLT